MILIELANYLTAQGLLKFDALGTTGDTFINRLPASPDNIYGIYSRVGEPMEAGLGYRKPHIQIIVRDTDQTDAYLRADKIYESLHGESLIDMGEYHVISIMGLQSEPAYIGIDENNRHEYSLNFAIEYLK